MRKVYIPINGTKLGMFLIEDQNEMDKANPVLLFLGGGPGIPEYFMEQQYPTDLKKEFVVCYLEYRGTSLSYDPKLDKKTMTTKQYIEDVIEVTKYLCKRFNQKKIYLMGHSFGTYIALNTVSVHPELYHAYIAISQLCSQRESELLAYDYMLEQYRAKHNNKKCKAFEKYHIKESNKEYQAYCTSLIRDNSMHELGIGTARDMKSLAKGIIFPSLRCKAYTPMQRINIWRGKKFAQGTQVAHEAWDFIASERIKRVDIPIYFFAGKYDYTCCYSLQKAYYEMVQAPLKGFYTFEESAHSPLFEEPKISLEILHRDVKKGRNHLSDEYRRERR